MMTVLKQYFKLTSGNGYPTLMPLYSQLQVEVQISPLPTCTINCWSSSRSYVLFQPKFYGISGEMKDLTGPLGNW